MDRVIGITAVGEQIVLDDDLLQRLYALPPPEGDEPLNTLDLQKTYSANMLSIAMDARLILRALANCDLETPPDPSGFEEKSHGWYAALTWKYADAIFLRDKMPFEFKMAWSQKLGEAMAEWLFNHQNKDDIVRGAKILSSSKKGGEITSSQNAARNAEILGAMKKLIDECKNVKLAAERAYKRRLGTSAEANRKLWYRHQPPVPSDG